MTAEYEYAKDLATYLWETHYKNDAPEWEPCDDLMGVLTQIDNMITGLSSLRHVDSPDCWCEPELDYEDPETGAQVWVHREVH